MKNIVWDDPLSLGIVKECLDAYSLIVPKHFTFSRERTKLTLRIDNLMEYSCKCFQETSYITDCFFQSTENIKKINTWRDASDYADYHSVPIILFSSKVIHQVRS